jgi:hypothetical protein
VKTATLSEIYSKRSRRPESKPSYYASIERDLTSTDIFTDLLCRYYVRIYDRNNLSQSSVARVSATTKWGAALWAKRWIKRQSKDKLIFYIDLDK